MNSSRILAAVGIGPESELAIAQADELARATGGELHLCHAIPNALGGYPFFYGYPSFYLGAPGGEKTAGFNADGGELRRKLVEELATYVVRVTGREPGSFQVEVHQGRTDEVILAAAHKCGATTIVVGAGVDVRERAPDLRGILRHAEIPVRIARPRSATKRIVVGTDLSDPALPAVQAGALESKRTGGEVTLVHSVEMTSAVPVWSAMGPIAFDVPLEVRNDLRKEIEARLAAALEENGIVGHRRVTEGSPIRALIAAASELDADLLVVGTQGRTGLTRALIGSVAEEVAIEARCSVLVVRLAHT